MSQYIWILITLIYRTPKLLSLFNKYLEILKEKLQETQTSRLLSPQEVVIEVVPRVLQGFWEHPPYPLLNLASQSLSELSTCVTKATLDQLSNTPRAQESKAIFSRSVRDDMVQTILAEIREKHPDDTVLSNTANHTTLLTTIAGVATNHICKILQPQIPNEPVHHTQAAQCPTRDQYDLNITGTEEESTSPEINDDMVTPGSLSASAESPFLSEVQASEEHPSETSSMCEPLIPVTNTAESCEDLKTKKKEKGFLQKLFKALCCFCFCISLPATDWLSLRLLSPLLFIFSLYQKANKNKEFSIKFHVASCLLLWKFFVLLGSRTKISSQQDRSVQVSRGAATLCKADPQQSV